MNEFARKTGKMIIMLLAALTLLFVMAACNRGNNDEPGATVAPTPGGVTPTAQPTATPPPADAPPRVITFSGHYGHTMFGAMPHEEPDWDEVSDIELAQMQWQNFLDVQERFNVRFEFNITDEYTTYLEYFMNGQMAGQPVGDIVFLSGTMIGPAVQAGQLIDLSTLQFPGSDLHGARNYVIPTFQQGSAIYQINSNNGGSIWSTDGMVVNMELVNRLGLPDPVALYEAGQWNWPNFLSIMRQAKDLGYFGIAGVLQDVGKGLMGANDGTTVTPDMNYGFDQRNTVESLELYVTILEERLWRYDIDGEAHTDWGRSSGAFNQGDSVFGAVRLWMNWSDLEDVQALPFPKGPSNRSGNTWADGAQSAITIPVGVEDPTFVLQVIEALYAWPGDDVWLLQYANLNGARQQFNDEGSAQRWAVLGSHAGSDPGLDHTEYRYFWGGDGLFDVIWDGTGTLAEFIETARGPRQAVLDRIFRGQ
jgi:hypothetical protein